ncbi:MAG: DEAD/DEAH box helicase family protein [Calothrix sp. SM1_5_4]|nr:DEAD/DEAH box helicase family protein [Calothrix sp. SM1_5_4]
MRERGSLDAGKAFKGKLRPYQKEGLAWLTTLSENGIGGVLADDMGLGKTIQILALLSRQRARKDAPRRPSLVVAPKTLIFNWQQEAAKFTPGFKVLALTGPDRRKHLADPTELAEYDLVLTTYQSLRIDIQALREVEFEYFILDEAHFVKNPVAQASIACRLVNARGKIALSGTPVENSANDLFSLMAIVNPGLLTEEQARDWAKSKDPEALRSLGRALTPFLLRRTKEQVLKDLPKRTEQVLYCELSTEERKRYDELKSYYWSNLQDKFRQKGLAAPRSKCSRRFCASGRPPATRVCWPRSGPPGPETSPSSPSRPSSNC